MGKDVFCFRLSDRHVEALDALACGRGDAVRFLIEKEVCDEDVREGLVKCLNKLGVSDELVGRVERELKDDGCGRQLSVAWYE